MKLARTIVDLAGNEEIQSVHLAEALHATRSSEVNAGVSVDPSFDSKTRETFGHVLAGHFAETDAERDRCILIQVLFIYLRLPSTIPPMLARTHPIKVNLAARVFGGGSRSQ